MIKAYIKLLFILLFLTLSVVSCISGTKKTVTEPDTTKITEEEEKQKEEALLKKQQEEEAQKKKEEKQYDGDRYVGKAKKDFASGIESYFQEGCSASIEKWKAAYEKDPLSQIAFNVALCYERNGDNKNSFDWYLKSFETNSTEARPLYNAYFIFPQKNGDKFEKMMEYALKITDEVEKNIFISWLNFEKGDLENTIKYAKKALKLDEQNIDAMVVLGRAYYKKKMMELATSIFSTAEQINPDNFKLQRIYGFLEYDKKNKSSALLHFQKAKKLNPEMPEVLNMIAILYMETEDFAMAEKELQSALTLYPDFYSAKLNLAIVYKGLSKFKESAALFSELEKDKNFPQELKKSLYYNKAILYLDADVDGDKNPERYDFATETLNQYLEYVPKNDKEERKKVAEYIKEAAVGKKKLVLYQKMMQRKEQKRKEEEEEEKRYKEMQKNQAKESAEKEQSEKSDVPEIKDEKETPEPSVDEDSESVPADENNETSNDAEIQN